MRISGVWLVIAVAFRLVTLSIWIGLIILLGYIAVVLFGAMADAGRIWFAPFIGLLIAGYAVVRSAWMLFVPPFGLERAVALAKQDAPKLYDLIDQVAERVGCSPPDYVVLGISSSFHVTQATLTLLDGNKIRGRVLHLSAPLLRVLPVDHLKAILAHEFAHFTGGDTVYSVHIAPVYATCTTALQQLWAQLTDDIDSVWDIIMRLFYIPPLIIIYVYYLGFQIIDRKMSRTRELRADRVAGETYSHSVMAAALIMSVGFGVVSDAICNDHYLSLISKGQTFTNYPQYFSQIRHDLISAAEEEVIAHMAERAGILDTHPALADRLSSLSVDQDWIKRELRSHTTITEENEITPLEEKLSELYTDYLVFRYGITAGVAEEEASP